MTDLDLKSPATCTRCKGTCKRVSPGFTALDGTVYPERIYDCTACGGRGTFPALDIPAITALILTGKDRRFRKSWPSKLSPWRSKDAHERRAYYVWRLARFHGGADVTMPMTAMTVSEGDPFKKVLDALSDVVARKVYGSDMAAAHRWGSLLGFSKGAPEGLPAAAYENGPVVTDGQKPDFEQLELV
jgi:hypothetical protein